mgnify:CR=1 FL=1
MTFWKCSSKFFTYELSRAKTMVAGFAWALRAIQGAPTTPVAPAASFRKSRRLGLNGAAFDMPFPLVCDTGSFSSFGDDAALTDGSSSFA